MRRLGVTAVAYTLPIGVWILVAGGCDTPSVTEIPGVAEVMGVATDAAGPSGDITDPCCFPGESGQPMTDQCEDQLVYENVCTRAPMCCEDSWHPMCASAYATYASSCATLPQAGAGSSGSTGGGGSYVPSEEIQKKHPSIQVELHVDMEPRSEDDVGGNLFLAGFDTLEERSGRPGQNVQPVHYTQLATFIQDWPYQGTHEVFSGLHYWAMYGTGEHPRGGDRMSDLMSSRNASMPYPRTSSIWKRGISAIEAANRVDDCLPEPPTPTSIAFPLGCRRMRETRVTCSRAS